MKRIVIWLLLFLCFGGVSLAGPPALESDNDKINYSVGFQIGGDFRRQGVELNSEALVQGVRDALSETATPLLDEKEMQDTLVTLKKKIDATAEEGRKVEARFRLEEGRKFLAENAAKEGVVTLPSGLQYTVIKEGTGKKPQATDTVTVNYRGTLISGQEFDSSFRRNKPATVALKSVIPGWQEALPMMKEGAEWKLFLPPALAFGERGPLADTAVIYDVELLSIGTSEQ